MTVRASDLPPALRAKLGVPAAPKRRRRTAPLKGATWTCHACAERFTALTVAERHAHTTGHHRINCELR